MWIRFTGRVLNIRPLDLSKSLYDLKLKVVASENLWEKPYGISSLLDTSAYWHSFSYIHTVPKSSPSSKDRILKLLWLIGWLYIFLLVQIHGVVLTCHALRLGAMGPKVWSFNHKAWVKFHNAGLRTMVSISNLTI